MSYKSIEQGSTLLPGEDGNLKVIDPDNMTIDSYVVVPIRAFPSASDYTETPSDREGWTDIELSVGFQGFKILEATITVITADFLTYRIKDDVFPEDATHVALAENPIRIVAVKFCKEWHRTV